MEPLIYLIEQPPALIKSHLDSISTWESKPRFELANWDSPLREKLLWCNAQLIVAVAVPMTPQAIGFFKWLREHPIQTPILAVLPSDIDGETLGAISESADDFILWPIHEVELRHRLQRILGANGDKAELESARSHLTASVGMGQLVGNHPAFVRAIHPIPLFARSDLPVLITGPTGTGKELCARAIHLLGNRRNFPFIAADCGAIPDHLLENELFGHVRGAFTDAHADQKGLAAMAKGGTLFLDEIDALSLCAQAKLLRFLQERSYRPLGGDRIIRAEVHVIAATNRDIESCVAQKLFRSDLYFRLNALRLQLPSLIERQSDIELLARHFLNTRSSSSGSTRNTFSPAALRKLKSYDWPGNVRELFNVVECAALFAEGQQILPSHISLPVPDNDDYNSASDFSRARARAIEAFERSYVESLLRKHDGNVTRAAVEARKDRRSFGRLKKKYGIML